MLIEEISELDEGERNVELSLPIDNFIYNFNVSLHIIFKKIRGSRIWDELDCLKIESSFSTLIY